ncbi:DUF4439 domain-containing protein [Georgenia sp.]
MRRPSPRPSWPRRTAARTAPAAAAGRWALAVSAALLLAGCGVRLDSPPPTVPVPDDVEVVRQHEATLAATLALDVPQITTADPAVTAQLELVADQARAHADALGGVWEPWPDGVPAGVTVPEPVSPPAPATAEDVLALLAAGAASARDEALTTPDDALAATLVATSISRAHAAADLAGVLGLPVTTPEAAPLSREALVARGADGPTVLVLDAARYALETVAARSDGPVRQAARERVASLQSLIDTALAAGAPDGRLPAYDLEAEDPAAVAAAAEARLLEHWLFSLTLVAPGERGDLVAAAQDAADRVRAWGGTLGALPGLA